MLILFDVEVNHGILIKVLFWKINFSCFVLLKTDMFFKCCPTHQNALITNIFKAKCYFMLVLTYCEMFERKYAIELVEVEL